MWPVFSHSQGSLAAQQPASSGSSQRHLLSHPPTRGNWKPTPLETDSFVLWQKLGEADSKWMWGVAYHTKTIESQGNHREETADKCLKQGTHNHESCNITAGYQMICKSRRFRNSFAGTTHMRCSSEPQNQGLKQLKSRVARGINVFLPCYLSSSIHK